MASSDKVKKLHGEVEKLKDDVRGNFKKLFKRGENIENAQYRSELLKEEAEKFKIAGTDIKRKMWWKNFKMWLVLIVVLIVIIAAVLIWVLSTQFTSESKRSNTMTSAPNTPSIKP